MTKFMPGAVAASARRFAGAADVARACELLAACLAADEAQSNLSVAELRQVLPRPTTHATQNARLWEGPDREVLGFGLVWTPDPVNVVLLVHPGVRGRARTRLAQEILTWVVGRAGEIAAEEGRPIDLQARPRESNRPLTELLARAGFTEERWHTLRYVRRLDDPRAALEAPAAPPGFALRPLRGEREVEAFVALHRAAFAETTVPERLALMRDADYVPELDLVAEAPGGELVAFVTAGIDRDAAAGRGAPVGYTDPIGAHPAYRRMGLARALLLEALHRLRAHGAVEARAGTGSWNGATQRLLESAGYEVAFRTLAYRLRVNPAPS